MVILYFSGTGNSKYVAGQLAAGMKARCYSIEEDIDFEKALRKVKVLGICYPIYGSCVPRIMREFVKAHESVFQGKKLVIVSTQMIFSGNGAKAFTKLLPGSEKQVIYAEHINMPNNMCNLFFFPWMSWERRRKPKQAKRKIRRICKELRNGKRRLRGWGRFSKFLGESQSREFPKLEEIHRKSFKADEDCIGCGLCVRACPMKNLSLTEDRKVEQHDNCTLCYRCVNLCPKQAATVVFHGKPKCQYKGVSDRNL